MAGAGGADGVHRDARIAVGAVLKPTGQESAEAISRWIWLSVVRAPMAPADEIGDKLTGHHIEKLGGRRYPSSLTCSSRRRASSIPWLTR